MKCDHDDCGKHFRKWHNFFDHLRIHTHERPYVCPFSGCGFSFTQRANLNKHVEVHGGNKRFECPYCPRMFFTNFNLKVRFYKLLLIPFLESSWNSLKIIKEKNRNILQKENHSLSIYKFTTTSTKFMTI